MAYRQYTRCVQPGDYVNFGFTAVGIRNLLAMLFGGIFLAFLTWAIIGGPGALLAAISVMISIIVALHWWLNGRLICLNDEPCVIGLVRSLSAADPSPTGKMGDDDFSMNLLLPPGPTALRQDYTPEHPPQPPVSDYQNARQGRLVQPHPSILAISRPYVEDEGHLQYVTALHCEFEGSGIRNLLIWAGIVLAFLIGALVVQTALSGLGWLATLLVLLAFIFTGLGLTTGPFAGPGAPGSGDPTDVDEGLKDLSVGDIVVVKGEWVYDSLHHGWNEIHPVRACCIIAKGSEIGSGIHLPWPPFLATDADVDALLKRWCPMLEDARQCEEAGSRGDPANGWILHPLVDGCRNAIIT